MPNIEQGHTGSIKHAHQSKSIDERSMHKGWKMRQALTADWIDAKVPGTNFTALYEAGKIEDPFYRDNERKLQWIEEKDWEYELEFNISNDDLLAQKLELVFEGLDTYADVYLNDDLVLSTDNMFLKWHLSCKQYLRVGSNTLRIYFHSPVHKVRPQFEKGGITFPAENDKTKDHLSVFTRKAPYHYGWDWGPKFVTSGIWRPVFLRLIDNLIIRNVQIHQESVNEAVASFTGSLAVESSSDQEVKLLTKSNGTVVAENEFNLVKGINDCIVSFDIQDPQRWWPAGMGEQNLYDITFEVQAIDCTIAESRKVGIREFEVVNAPDDEGQSFYFKVNGVPFFSKGANYIPSDSFLDRVTPEKYRQIFEDAVAANMNTLRVWGGGIYEVDLFYDLADEYGIVIWQDFMFACTMYPWDKDFLANIEKEAVSNIRRLRNHACLGLWCGNNEVQMGWDNWGWQDRFDYSAKDQKRMYEGYEKLFHKLLPELVEEYDKGRFYFPSSPISNWDKLEKFKVGDQHYWGVWHGEEPFENFNKFVPRFMSEFGFQSFPMLNTVKSYAQPEDLRIDSDAMQVHQKHPRGNQLIEEYMLRDYREPKDFENFLYLSQVLQAEGMTMGFEAHRRNMPFCMGSLYWQFNDCWPVASWSGIDYYGRWKAMHYAARHAFDNLLITFDQKGSDLQVYVVSDLLEDLDGLLRLEVLNFQGEIHFSHKTKITAAANSSSIYCTQKLDNLIGNQRKSQIVLKASLFNGENQLCQSLFYFESPKNLELKHTEVNTEVVVQERKLLVTLTTDQLAKNVYLSADGLPGNFSDNFFDLLPGESKTVHIPIPEGQGGKIEDIKILTVNDASLYS